MRNSTERRVYAALVLGAVLVAPAAARAYGVEVPENGSVAMGRAGAFVTRASDPSAVMHNPAGIVGLSGFQLTVATNLGAFSHCYDRAGNYQSARDATVNTYSMTSMGTRIGTRFDPMATGNAPYISGNVPYPETCKEFSVAIAPMLLGTYRINRYVGIGFGVFAPSTTGAGQSFPDTVTATDSMTGRSFDAPSPARNLLFRKQLLALYPSLAVSVAPTPWLRVGVTGSVGLARFNFGLMANAEDAAPQATGTDLFVDLTASGLLIAVTPGIQVLPLPFLSFGASFRYNFPITASGTGNTTAGYYSSQASAMYSSSFNIDKMEVQYPWVLRAGVRYNHPRPGRPTQNDGSGQYDPMTDDVFDVEATFNYEATNLLSETSLTNSGSIRVNDMVMVLAPGSSPRPPIVIRSALSDVMGVRVGGDWNILPGRFAVRLGGSYETAGVSPDLAQIHLPAYAGGSIHAGFSYRWRWLTLNFAAAQFFFQSNEATNARRAVTTPNAINPDSASMCMIVGEGACTINRGVYSASYTAINLGATVRF